jgi:hypothetical protein
MSPGCGGHGSRKKVKGTDLSEHIIIVLMAVVGYPILTNSN